jgi:hypothetical protein
LKNKISLKHNIYQQFTYGGNSVMWNKNILIQIRILFGIILLNFIAQVPYFFHLYYHKFSDLKRLFNLPMGLVFALFIIAYILLVKHRKTGYWLMILFLSMEFLFYLWNAIGSFRHGFGLFLQLYNHDLTLRIVFAIGYLNLFASGYFLCFLLYKKDVFIKKLNQFNG